MVSICNFPGSRPIGKPTEWDESLDGPCACIYVTDQTDILTGANMMYSVYKLSDAELAALREGGLLRLGIMGRAHPVFQLDVLGPRLSERVEAVPSGDLGEVIEVE